MRKLLITVALVYIIMYAYAQHSFRGTVSGVENHAIEGAVVQLIAPSGRIAGYTLTDAKGSFALASRLPADSLELSVSVLGYKTYRKKSPPAQLSVSLEQEVFTLREVEVKAGRIWSRSDTINYDVAQFLSAKDESIKDVLRKLPGVDVSEVGRISYNGKEINNFYVEGLDLAGGRYNQITNNLEAKAVESVQVLENHQPVKMLRDRIKTDEVALNLKLKKEFRDRWMFVIQAGAGVPDAVWDAGANAFQLSRKSQSSYSYKGNSSGKDISDEQTLMFVSGNGTVREPDVQPLLGQPSISAPLRKERLLFNNIHTASANRLYRTGADSRLRFNAMFAQDERRQERGSITQYFRTDGDVEQISESSLMKLNSRNAELAADFENNADKRFVTDRFKLAGLWDESATVFDRGIGGSMGQNIKTANLSMRNELNGMWNIGNQSLEARSLIRYNNSPSEMTLNALPSDRLPLSSFYADHSLAYLQKRGLLTQKYTAGLNLQATNLANVYSPFLIPNFQLSRSKWYATLTAPLLYTVYEGKNISRLSVSPSLSLQYRPHYAWRLSASASLRESFGSISSFAPEHYADYRTVVAPNGIMPLNRQQTYSVYGEYRRTVYEFFATLSVTRYLMRSNSMVDETFDSGIRRLSTIAAERDGSGWSIQGAISKGFYGSGLKTSLNYVLSRNDGEQMSYGRRLNYRSDYIQLEPKVSWNPFRRMEFSYQGNVRYGGSEIGTASLKALCNLVQTFRLSYEYGGLEYNLSGDHYYNELGLSQSTGVMLADFSVRWKPGRWQVELSATNILDKKQYSYTQYSSTQSFYSWINIRGREIMGSLKYRF